MNNKYTVLIDNRETCHTAEDLQTIISESLGVKKNWVSVIKLK